MSGFVLLNIFKEQNQDFYYFLDLSIDRISSTNPGFEVWEQDVVNDLVTSDDLRTYELPPGDYMVTAISDLCFGQMTFSVYENELTELDFEVRMSGIAIYGQNEYSEGYQATVVVEEYTEDGLVELFRLITNVHQPIWFPMHPGEFAIRIEGPTFYGEAGYGPFNQIRVTPGSVTNVFLELNEWPRIFWETSLNVMSPGGYYTPGPNTDLLTFNLSHYHDDPLEATSFEFMVTTVSFGSVPLEADNCRLWTPGMLSPFGGPVTYYAQDCNDGVCHRFFRFTSGIDMVKVVLAGGQRPEEITFSCDVSVSQHDDVFFAKLIDINTNCPPETICTATELPIVGYPLIHP